MDEETKWVLGGIGTLSSLIGLWEYFKRRNQRAMQREYDRIEMLKVLKRIEVIDEHLEDVLSHPDDSGFGVGDIERRQGDIMERLERIERYILGTKPS